MNALAKLWRGQFSLAATYWGFGVLGSILVFLPLKLLTPGSAAAILLGVVFCLYLIAACVGTWRSATSYSGPSAWAVLSKVAAVIGCLWAAGVLALIVTAPGPAQLQAPSVQPPSQTPRAPANPQLPTTMPDGAPCGDIGVFLEICKR